MWKYKYDTEWFFDNSEIRLIFKNYIPICKEKVELGKRTKSLYINYDEISQETKTILY